MKRGREGIHVRMKRRRDGMCEERREGMHKERDGGLYKEWVVRVV
jgi:hypothetical protein